MIKLRPLDIPDVLEIEPMVYEDSRGFFFESYNQFELESALNRKINFVQDNHSYSTKNVLRGLHFQTIQSQAKLIRVVSGEIFDVAVDVRRDSCTFGGWVSSVISAANRKQVWIPEGFAHGFLVLSESAEVLYKTTDFYSPENERCIIWNDPDVGIIWPTKTNPVMSVKDLSGLSLRQLTTLI